MLTVRCPNCDHQFLTNEKQKDDSNSEAMPCAEGRWLMSEEYSNDGYYVDDYMINAPTIISEENSPKYLIQSGGSCIDYVKRIIDTETIDLTKGTKCINNKSMKNSPYFLKRLTKAPRSDLSDNQTQKEKEDCTSSSICRMTGGSVTISTPNVQSDFNHSTDSCTLAEVPYDMIHPKLSVGGSFVQTKISTDDQDESSAGKSTINKKNCGCSCFREHHCSNEITMEAPSGCQELPGIRRNPLSKCCSEKRPIEEDFDRTCYNFNDDYSGFSNLKIMSKQDYQSTDRNYIQEEPVILKQMPPTRRNFCQSLVYCVGPRPNHIEKNSDCLRDFQTYKKNATMINNGLAFNPSTGDFLKNSNCNESLHTSNGSVQLQLNATLQLPPDIEQCSLNITATRSNSSCPEHPVVAGSCNNLNDDVIVKSDVKKKINPDEYIYYNSEEKEETPTTPVSWVMPVGLNSFLINDFGDDHLLKVKKHLRACGWYHEGLSWQKSEILLKDAAIGRWLMRDSSDSRYTFAVSVQTERGPTSVRVHHVNGFRLDAEPSLINAMPFFNCPIRLLEYYVEYSKKVNKNKLRREVWVDFSGQFYSQIYLAEPLVKEVRSLSHLARLVINKHKLPTHNLPLIIRKYVLQYPYTI